jgi:hypothetical protein
MIDGIREHGHGRHDRHLTRASYFDDEMEAGWLVVASQAVRDAMQSQLCTLKHLVQVESSFYNEGERLQRDMHAEHIMNR